MKLAVINALDIIIITKPLDCKQLFKSITSISDQCENYATYELKFTKLIDESNIKDISVFDERWIELISSCCHNAVVDAKIECLDQQIINYIKSIAFIKPNCLQYILLHNISTVLYAKTKLIDIVSPLLAEIDLTKHSNLSIKLFNGQYNNISKNDISDILMHHKDIKPYQICVICNTLPNNMIHDAWEILFDEKHINCASNTKMWKEHRPDYICLRLQQIPSLIALISKDCEYIVKLENCNNCKILPSLPSRSLIRIGYLFEDKKISFLCDAGLLLHDCNFLYIPVLPYIPVKDQGPFKLILQKINKNFQLLKELQIEYPHAVFIDSLESMSLTLSRKESNDRLQDVFNSQQCKCIMSKHNIKIHSSEMCDAKSLLVKEGSIYFIKPSVAIGTSNSHILSLVNSTKGLSECLQFYNTTNLFAEKFIKHYGLIYKLYTVGEKVYYNTKNSIISDIPLHDFAYFDSQKPFPKEWVNTNALQHEQVNMEFIKQIVQLIYQSLHLSMLGLDLVVEEGTGDYYIIDLNYFTVPKKNTDKCVEDVKEYLKKKAELS